MKQNTLSSFKVSGVKNQFHCLVEPKTERNSEYLKPQSFPKWNLLNDFAKSVCAVPVGPLIQSYLFQMKVNLTTSSFEADSRGLWEYHKLKHAVNTGYACDGCITEYKRPRHFVRALP